VSSARAAEPAAAPAPDAERPRRGRFFRPAPTPLDFDGPGDDFGPNFSKMKDDLDVPAFLRKQMD
jgi:hypothetical protein